MIGQTKSWGRSKHILHFYHFNIEATKALNGTVSREGSQSEAVKIWYGSSFCWHIQTTCWENCNCCKAPHESALATHIGTCSSQPCLHPCRRHKFQTNVLGCKEYSTLHSNFFRIFGGRVMISASRECVRFSLSLQFDLVRPPWLPRFVWRGIRQCMPIDGACTEAQLLSTALIRY